MNKILKGQVKKFSPISGGSTNPRPIQPYHLQAMLIACPCPFKSIGVGYGCKKVMQSVNSKSANGKSGNGESVKKFYRVKFVLKSSLLKYEIRKLPKQLYMIPQNI